MLCLAFPLVFLELANEFRKILILRNKKITASWLCLHIFKRFYNPMKTKHNEKISNNLLTALPRLEV